MVGYIIYRMTRFWLLFQRGKMSVDSQTRKRRYCKIYVQGLPDKHHYSRENHLGAALGSKSYWSEYSYKKWRMGKRSLLSNLQEYSLRQVMQHMVWTKTSIDVFFSNHTRHSRLLEQLENTIVSIFLPVLVDHNSFPLEREVLLLPVKRGGIGSAKPCNEATSEHLISIEVRTPLIEKIQSQPDQLPEDSEVQHLNNVVKVKRNEM